MHKLSISISQRHTTGLSHRDIYFENNEPTHWSKYTPPLLSHCSILWSVFIKFSSIEAHMKKTDAVANSRQIQKIDTFIKIISRSRALSQECARVTCKVWLNNFILIRASRCKQVNFFDLYSLKLQKMRHSGLKLKVYPRLGLEAKTDFNFVPIFESQMKYPWPTH